MTLAGSPAPAALPCPAQPLLPCPALPCPVLPAVEEVGPEVKEVRKGDRVVVAFDIACGTCFYCRNSYYTSCVSAGLAPAAPDPGCAPAWRASRGEGHRHGVWLPGGCRRLPRPWEAPTPPHRMLRLAPAACSLQDNTNPSKEQEMMYGHRSGGFFGYSHLTGGWDGGQAEYVRVPFGAPAAARHVCCQQDRS